MVDDPRFVDMSAMMQDATKELNRLCAEINEEEAFYAAGGVLSAAIGFLAIRRGTQHAIMVLDGQLSFLREVQALGGIAPEKGMGH